jgi:hypothetical protein
MTEHRLVGLDGSNPLAFFAALGVLQALADAGVMANLRWELQGRWRPFLRAALDEEALVALLDADRESWEQEPALAFTYQKDGDGAVQRDLKPPPGGARTLFTSLSPTLGDAPHPRSLAMAAAYFTETAVDGKGNAKPTALHFTAGQQQFLSMAVELQKQVTREDLRAALFATWVATRELPVLGWDASGARDYALRASDPSKDKKTGIPGADWLAFRALPNLAVAPQGDRVATPGISGGWKTGRLTWPLWTVPIDLATVRSLLCLPGLAQVKAEHRLARGIGVVYECGIQRSDQGGYGSFRPARPV